MEHKQQKNQNAPASITALSACFNAVHTRESADVRSIFLSVMSVTLKLARNVSTGTGVTRAFPGIVGETESASSKRYSVFIASPQFVMPALTDR